MKNKWLHIDWWLMVPIVFLLLISLTVLFSIDPAHFWNQLFALGVATVAFFVFSQIPYKDLELFAKPFYFVSIFLLVIVLLIGFEARGAVRWINIFGFSLQASEIIKPLLSLSLASFLAGNTNRSLKMYVLTLLFLVPVVVLIQLQPDLGNALIFAGVSVATLVVYGIPWIWLFVSALPLLLAAPFIWNLLHDYQRQRVLTFLNPLQDPQGSSYNLIQAVIAVGSGMVMGKGIGEGTQSQLKFLPENHTDFIFASLSEKLGFLGSFIVIMAFIALLYRIYRIFHRSKDAFGKLFCVSAFLFLLIHFFVNIGMNLGLVPVVGVTLPFVSFGGSSLLSNFIFLGILSAISTANNKKDVLQIR